MNHKSANNRGQTLTVKDMEVQQGNGSITLSLSINNWCWASTEKLTRVRYLGKEVVSNHKGDLHAFQVAHKVLSKSLLELLVQKKAFYNQAESIKRMNQKIRSKAER
jgi:hypothetical protein